MLSVMICIIQLVLGRWYRSEEHTSELQSRSDLVCRLLLEKKKNTDHLMSASVENVHGRHQRVDDLGPGLVESNVKDVSAALSGVLGTGEVRQHARYEDHTG